MTGMVRLQVIGGGKMGEALLVGLVGNGWAAADELHVVEPDPARQRAVAAAAVGVSVSTEPLYGIDAVIAVKPDIVAAVLPALAEAGAPRVLSIAAGVRTDAIEAGLPAGTAVVRAMPNTPRWSAEARPPSRQGQRLPLKTWNGPAGYSKRWERSPSSARPTSTR